MTHQEFLKSNNRKNVQNWSKLKLINAILAFIFAFFLLAVPPTFAHTPHDVISQIAISPNYQQDQTAFVIVRGNLMKSTDGGQHWQRIVRGLDNRSHLASLAASSQDAKILFLSTLGDGIYKSQDAGESWFKVNQGLENFKIELLAISDVSPDLILAAAKETEIYKSNNGGKNWHPVFETKAPITTLAFAADQAYIAAGDQQGNIYLSQDEGEIWQLVSKLKNSGEITVITLSPQFSSDSTFWVGTDKGGLFKTVDKGLNFIASNQGISEKNIRDIIVSPNYDQDGSLFASTWHNGAFKSSDQGKTWTQSSQGLTKHSQADETQFHSPHFSELAISPAFNQDKTLFLAGFNGLFKSTDGGNIWHELETLSPQLITSLAISPNYQNYSTLALGTYDEGIYISSNQGKAWKPSNTGLFVPKIRQNASVSTCNNCIVFISPFTIEKPRFFDLAFSPNYAQDNTIFGTLTYQFLKSTNRGRNWKNIGFPSREIMIVVSPNFASDKTVYLGTYDGVIYKSIDGGNHFSILSQVGQRVLSIVISPNFASDKTLYVSAVRGIYKTVNGGETWQLTPPNSSLKDRVWQQVAISPNYKADKTIIAASDQGVFQSQNAGESWIKLSSSTEIDQGLVEAIAISPNYSSDRTFIVSVRGRGLFKTVDNGTTFTQIAENLFEKNYSFSIVDNVASSSIPIQFSPTYAFDKTLYGFGANDRQVFKSIDGGKTWEIITVPRQTDMRSNFITSLYMINLILKVYPLVKFVIAAILALASYFILGYLGLEKKLPLSKLQIKTSGAFIVLVVILALLYA